jgi:transcriptional regulator with XRE-family HTH domain
MSRSLKVRSDRIQQAKLALKRNSFGSQRSFAEELGLALSTLSRFLTGKTVDYATFVEFCGKLAIDWREISDLGDQVPSQSVEVKFSNVLAKPTITAQSCGNIINLLRQLQVDLSSY